MERQKIDRIIDAFRSAMYSEFKVEEEAPANSVGSNPAGYSSDAAAKGPVSGFSPVMSTQSRFDGRTKAMKKFLSNLEKNRGKRKARKEKKAALNYNPYFSSSNES